MKMLACAGLVISLSAGSALAGDWRLVSVGRSGATALDLTSVSRSGDTGAGWTAVLLPNQRNGMDYALVRQEYDCRASTSTILSLVSYDEAGQMLNRTDHRRQATYIAPGSSEVLMLEAVCNDKFVVADPTGWDGPAELLRVYRATLSQ